MGMTVGVSLPTMARGFSGDTFRTWCRGIDEGPYTSISTGERITFFNPELLTTLAGAAAITERVNIFANLVVAPLHRSALLAKQLATIDQLCNGRLIVGLGVGGRPHDYLAVDEPFARRHQQVDEMAASLRALWSQQPPFAGADPVGPPPVRDGGPTVVAGVLGKKAMERVAAWADGVTGFSLSGTFDEMDSQAEFARVAWAERGRTVQPWLGSGTFCVLGVEETRSVLQEFGATYLSFFGEEAARSIAATLTVDSQDELLRLLADGERAGLNELTLVPGTWDERCLAAMTEVVSEWTTQQRGR